jgi:hypothetical protein
MESSASTPLGAAKYVLIEYVGRREPYIDGVCGSQLTFLKNGDVQMVKAAYAAKMLAHPSVYRLASSLPVQADPALQMQDQEADQDKERETREQADMRDSIMQMSKEALTAFAKTHFQQAIDGRKALDVNRRQVVAWMDQYGLNP